ncbi:hypothetical protein LH462_08365 [Laribacter hongkongensis]|uniref:Helicase ATP-binding domain-containing protein n=1 Tax=Laribacter hongkongensis TaxID=168471 RepID=A0ABD4SSH5_9NEIS|nr:hypothetical protein [Laribacter hongkongensis]MCG9025695.1 hypothetical protein [Laribacter hongkongensis]MCG9101252.1 hypothetical protein [Laribacter hongkongensis]MCG9103733.1 hypothetical protein [Laribacter hongkongensis]MCG9112834.1 hypothetical protein [Laribacter hongkongensis]MCG9118893.1 hypothetical protein [Laribacter hongkongensis]
MKEYQDTETGMIYAFEDDYDPFSANNRNIPKTLTAAVKQKPDDSHVWYQNTWVKQEDVPAGYTPPISSVPSYNPAWIAHLRPYSAVHRDASSGLNFTLDQINANSYDGSKLAEVVSLLPLGNSSGIPALVSYDGAIAIPQCSDFPSRVDGVRKLNEILCSLLLGGIHVEVLHSEGLVIGALQDKTRLFAYTPSLHASLRLNWAAPSDRLAPLMHPRVLMVDEMHKAFSQGQQVIQSIVSFSPFFLLSGYTAMAYRNNSDALSNLWITVEQLTDHLWGEQYLKNRSSFPAYVAKAHSKPRIKKTLRSISTKHKLLCLSNIFSKDCYRVLSRARRRRNELAHAGVVPDAGLIEQLWSVLPELIEVASGSGSLGLRRLSGGAVENGGMPARTDFDEWVNLARAFN